MSSIGTSRKRRGSRGWKRKIAAFFNTPIGDSLLKALFGGIIVQCAILSFQHAARERELIITVKQEQARLRSQLRTEFYRERDRNSRVAFRVMGALVTASENVMRIEEKDWRDLEFETSDQKAIADFEKQQRADYNDADEAWDRSEGMFDGLFAPLDKDDRVPQSWHEAREAIDELQSCIHEKYVASPPKTAPVDHPCRPAATQAREAIIEFGTALNVSKQRLISE